MVRKSVLRVRLVVAASLVLIPAVALAQSAIAGAVKDTTGAVLPGVTVEASSPALIEKVRTVVTDNQGLYKIIDLRPGVYAVTFTLTGFSAVKREGIDLTTNFTATVNTELRVGAIEETVTVSGQSPMVDVQNVVQQRVVTAELVEALPTGRTQQALAALIPGLIITSPARPSAQDVGGTSSEAQQRIGIHGGRPGEMWVTIDGIPQSVLTDSSGSGILLDGGAVQEFSYELGAISVETPSGGIRVNQIPKDGGNRFTGTVYAAFTNESLGSDNLTDELRARGFSTVNRLEKMWDVNPAFGGPLVKDRLWFYVSARSWGQDERLGGIFYDKDPRDFVYTPDLSRPAIDDTWLYNLSLRPTWQVTRRNKISAFLMLADRCNCHRSISTIRAPEAANYFSIPVNHLVQLSWSAPVTNRLLLEAAVMPYWFTYQSVQVRGLSPDLTAITELSTNLNFRAAPTYLVQKTRNYNERAALSYVTGSHAFKVGFTLQHGHRAVSTFANGDINLQLLNGLPRMITLWTTPYEEQLDQNAMLGIYARDQWTVKRLTLSAGVRFDHHNSSIAEQHLPAAQFVGPRDFAAVADVPNWYDLSPRLGAAYDLFGTGKTALKVTLSRYVMGETTGLASANNPINTSVNSATRTWTDLNGDFSPDCNFTNPATNGECGPLSNANFGKVNVTTRYDKDVLTGWGKRGYNWETSAGIQHELRPGVAVNATYFRRSYGNFLVTDNLLVTPADYDPFCITAPVGGRLPGGGGNQLCGLYDIRQARFGQVDNLVTFAKNFGTQYERWNGVDLSFNARLWQGALLSGGMSTGRTVFDNCDVTGKVDNPASTGNNGSAVATMASPNVLTCHQEPAFLTLAQVKLNGIVKLPWDLQAAGTFQSLPGPAITASYLAPNAAISPSLGRSLAAGANGTAPVELVQPGTMYAERVYQVDARLSKIFKTGRRRIQGNFDLYNALNASPVLALNTRYGPAWQQPTYILPGRQFKFGAQIDF